MSNKILIIGASGFVGEYLIRELLLDENYLIITKLPNENFYDYKNDKSLSTSSGQTFDYGEPEEWVKECDLDIRSKDEIKKVLLDFAPGTIFHLAAQSSVKVSWDNPSLTIDVNLIGTLNLVEVLRELKEKNDYSPRTLLIGSSEEYGVVSKKDCPIKEEQPVRPNNPYAKTKVAQNIIGSLYAKAYGLDIVMTRSFNHIGVGQSETFVVPNFCKQVAEIKMKAYSIGSSKIKPTIYVGNLSAKRDFADVEDVVKAYILLAKKGHPGETYNVGSGKAVSIKSILKEIIRISGVKICVETDEKRIRPVDVPYITADITKIKNHTGWAPKKLLTGTLSAMLNTYYAKLK